MNEVIIEVSEEEKEAVIKAIVEMNAIQHLKYMSQMSIAKLANIKVTKVRVVLMTLIKEGTVTQYQATENKRVQRYYYVINPKVVTGDTL